MVILFSIYIGLVVFKYETQNFLEIIYTHEHIKLELYMKYNSDFISAKDVDVEINFPQGINLFAFHLQMLHLQQQQQNAFEN